MGLSHMDYKKPNLKRTRAQKERTNTALIKLEQLLKNSITVKEYRLRKKAYSTTQKSKKL
jgi:hypothetical protein